MRGFISTGEEKDQLIAVRRIVDAISRTGIDPELAYAFPDRADVARIAVCKPLDAHVDARSTREISQAAEPLVKHIGSQELRHEGNVIYILQRVKWLEAANASQFRRQRATGSNVRIPAALFLVAKARADQFDASFHAVQALELVAGLVNMSLIALTRDGFMMAGRLRSPR